MTKCLFHHCLDPGYFEWKSQHGACWRLDHGLEIFGHAQNVQGTPQKQLLSYTDCFPSKLTGEVDAITAAHKLIESEWRRRPLYALLINIIKEQGAPSWKPHCLWTIQFSDNKGTHRLLIQVNSSLTRVPLFGRSKKQVKRRLHKLRHFEKISVR